MWFAGRHAERLAERIAETAVRFIPVAEYDFIQLCAFTDLRERLAQSSAPRIRLKRHAVVLDKIPSCPRWLDSHFAEVVISYSFPWIFVYQRKQFFHPARYTISNFKRVTAFARPKAGKKRIMRRRLKRDILFHWLACRARGSAKYIGSLNRHKKYSVIRRIFSVNCLLHFTFGRQNPPLTHQWCVLSPRRREDFCWTCLSI